MENEYQLQNIQPNLHNNDMYLKQSTASPIHPKPGILYENSLSNYTTNSFNQSTPTTTNTTAATTPYNPFNYVPTIATNRLPSTPSTSHRPTNSKTHRRRKTGSKRSIDDVISSTSIHTNVSFDSSASRLQGPVISLLTPMTPNFPPIHDPNFMFFGNMPLASPMPFGPSSSSAHHHPGMGPTLPLTVPVPPLSQATPINPASLQSDTTPRPKKKSKYSVEQDQTILRLKKEGKSWSDISDAANCGNSLAARNRYQVLIGQQGGGAVVWDAEDAQAFRDLLEEGEKAKWNHIAAELSRLRNKKMTPKVCQDKIKQMFATNPVTFGLAVSAPDQFPANGTMPQQNTYQPYPYMFNAGGSGNPPPPPVNPMTPAGSTSNTPGSAVYMPYGMPLQPAHGFTMSNPASLATTLNNTSLGSNINPNMSGGLSSNMNTNMNTNLTTNINTNINTPSFQPTPPPTHIMGEPPVPGTTLVPPTGIGMMSNVPPQIKTEERER